jgi:NADPH-dependent 2,4-dienoyl-CoA reductase/sulfur reductase-like enzyme
VPEPLHAEVAVVGAGPAGIAAAVRAGEAGRRVVLIDENPRPGGQIWRHRERFEAPAIAGWWMARLDRTRCERLDGASVVDAEPGGALLVEQNGQALRVAAEKVVLATGARELFLPFPGWTLPNVLGVGAMQSLLKSGFEVRGLRVVIAGSGPLLLPVAAAVKKAGGNLLVVAEQASASQVRRFGRGLWRHPGKLAAAARYRFAFLSVPYRRNVWVREAEGEDRLRRVTLTDGSRAWSGACDVLCAGYGLVPNVELAALLGCAIEEGRVVADDRQSTSLPGIFCAGEPTGIGGVELAVVDGEIAGLAAAGETSGLARLQRRRRRLTAFADRLEAAFAPRPELKERLTPDTLVCRCEDVPWGRLDPTWSPRQAKLATRLGMGPCQGRVCGPAMRFLCGWEADSVRPPIQPARISTLIAD